MKALYLALIFFSSFFILFLYICSQSNTSSRAHTDIDSKAYLANAELLYHNGSFAWPAPHDQECPYYVLGYPAIIAALYALFGYSTIPLLFFNLLLTLAALILMYGMVMLYDQQAASMSALLLATNLGFLSFSLFILTEITVTFFLLLFLYTTLYAIKKSSLHAFMLTAPALACSILIKPAALYFPFLYLPAAGLSLYHSYHDIKKTFFILSSWIALFALPLTLYATHQAAVFGKFYICKLDQENLLYWFYPHVRAAIHQTTADDERIFLRTLSQEDIRHVFLQDIRNHPFKASAIWLKNCLKTWLGLYTTHIKLLLEPELSGGDISFFKQQGSLYEKIKNYIRAGTDKEWLQALAWYEALFLVLRLCFLTLGFFWLYKKQEYASAIILLLYMAYFTIITGHDGCARFRMLLEPALILLSSLGIACFPDLFFTRRIDNKKALA